MGGVTPVLSVVMPAWNERGTIGAVVDDLVRQVAGPLGDAEVVVVDDASTDGTAEILAELDRRHEPLRVVRLERNRGHGGAVLAGLGLARGEWIFQLDSDGQVVVADFWRLWERREGADLVLGVRAERRDPAHRLVLSRVVSTTVTALVGRRVRDPNVPFRLIRRELWDDVSPLVGADALAPSILTVVGAVARGWRIAEVPVTHLPRAGGGSTLRAWRLVSFSARGLAQLVRFRLAVARAPARRGP